jgi:membrane peptidoglycan carboxypeptidase
MKKLLFAALLLSSTSIFAQKKADDIAKLSTETYDFGKVKQNVPPTATITVTNIGTEPLLIEQATPSCGCTVSDYTKSPIAPGKTGTIKATYNAAAVGQFNKTLTVKFAGADDVKFVKLTGEVLTPAAYDALKTTKEIGNKTAKTKKEVISKS